VAKLMLSVPIEVEIRDGKKKEKLKVELRDLTKEERKENEKLLKRLKEMLYRINRLERKRESVEKKRDYAEKLEKYKEAMEYQEKLDKIDEELDRIQREIEELGGDDYIEVEAKKNFTRLVSGEGVERLREIAETKGYATVMRLLNEAKAEVEGKQRGA